MKGEFMESQVSYRTISDFFFEKFGKKVRKIAVNAGCGCPGRCAYCNNAAFSPSYSMPGGGRLTKKSEDADQKTFGSTPITEQIQRGLAFNAGKADGAAYLIYFQSYTSTFGDVDKLIAKYEEALSFPGVAGLVIATRPDCLPEQLLDWFESRFAGSGRAGVTSREKQDSKPFLLVELGIESTSDRTLGNIHRGHDWKCAREAVLELDRRGIAVGAHLILGLPGESREDFLQHARRLSALPVSTLKLHQLQIIRGTEFERRYRENPEQFHMPTAEEYATTVAAFLKELRPDIALDRFVSEAPKDMVLAPAWGIKPAEFSRMLLEHLQGLLDDNLHRG